MIVVVETDLYVIIIVSFIIASSSSRIIKLSRAELL